MFALLEEETNCSCKRLPLFAAPATGSGAATGCRRVRPRLWGQRGAGVQGQQRGFCCPRGPWPLFPLRGIAVALRHTEFEYSPL